MAILAMDANRLLLGLKVCLLGAVFAAHIALYYVAFDGATRGLPWSASLIDMLFIAEVALLTLWATLGPGPLELRMYAVVLGFALIVVMEYYVHETLYGKYHNLFAPVAIGRQSGFATAVQVALLQFSVLFPSILVLRRRDRLANVGFLESEARPFQFSLRALFLLITTTALAARWSHSVRLASIDLSPVPHFAAIVFAAIPLVFADLLSMWALLLPGLAWRRVLILTVTTPVLGTIAPLACGRTEDLFEWILFSIFNTFVVAGTLTFLRLAGYRLMPIQGDSSRCTGFLAKRPTPRTESKETTLSGSAER